MTVGCAKQPSRPRAALGGYSYGTDPIVAGEHGTVSRATFRSFVAHRLATPWLRMLALGRAVEAELDAASKAPSRALVARVLAWVRDDGLLRAWQPAPNGQWRSGKAEIDTSWTLARIWVLRRQDGDEQPTPQRLRAAFLAEVARRDPVVNDAGAICDGRQVTSDEVYPDLLALMKPEQREALLLEAVGRF